MRDSLSYLILSIQNHYYNLWQTLSNKNRYDLSIIFRYANITKSQNVSYRANHKIETSVIDCQLLLISFQFQLIKLLKNPIDALLK